MLNLLSQLVYLMNFYLLWNLYWETHFGFCFVLHSTLKIFHIKLKLILLSPTFKHCDTSNVTNYKPISILSPSGKLLESLILRYIQPDTNAIIVDQHGFHPDKSITTCNIVFATYIFIVFKRCKQVYVIYINLKKSLWQSLPFYINEYYKKNLDLVNYYYLAFLRI